MMSHFGNHLDRRPGGRFDAGVRTPHVAFVSNSHEGAPLALALKRVPERAVPDLSVWVSEQEITDGKQWLAALNTALDAADDLLVLCSSTSLSAPWVNFEGGSGEGAGARVIPVCHRDLSIDDLPLPFSGVPGPPAGDGR